MKRLINVGSAVIVTVILKLADQDLSVTMLTVVLFILVEVMELNDKFKP